ncbi:MAG TPA: peptide chain release factor 2, partial [Acinetobacter lwoffii]|nr:peptide chain release factor 2 [Acinetobacter lwoffii]
GGIFDYDLKKERLEEVLRELEDPTIWNDQSRAQAMAKEKGELENVLNVLDR